MAAACLNGMVAKPADPTMDPAQERDAAIRHARSIGALRRAADGCRACDLWRNATQTVFGAGTPSARVMFVGEQPGDVEDRMGEPFVGPAGRILDQALEAAGIDRDLVYVTNVVKHFKWRRAPSGKRRLHQRPDRAEVEACRPWLEAEVKRIGPELIVCLGATAAQALLGSAFRVTRDRGRLVPTELGPPAIATVHPSAVLRVEGTDERELAFAELVADLVVVRDQLGG
jgi:uracil-DNA glycosylase family protein